MRAESRLWVRPKDGGPFMAERLNQFARCHEVVPVESYKKEGVDGWLFRDRDNRLIFIPISELLGQSTGQ